MYKPTIGLEIHIELTTESKMFCGCRNDSNEQKPNVNICPVCTAQPGALPVINQEAVKKVIKTALALNCKINQQTFFERKNYFYPDLPKGYQISQYQIPLSHNGFLELSSGKKIRITRIHLEEDTAKLLHAADKNYSLVDFNRAGIPLMELVTEPDIESAEEAQEFVRILQTTLRYLGVSTADMEKGQMRCEVNISLRKSEIRDAKSELGTKVEIKNLNSVRAVGKAIEYEVKRQKQVLEKGEKVIQETRGWHDVKQITFSQREKESSHDYRYFPEPDLPPLEVSKEFLNKIKDKIQELPQQKKQRFKTEFGISEKQIDLFIEQRDLGDYFEKVVSELKVWLKDQYSEITDKDLSRMIKLAANYIVTDLQFLIKEEKFKEEKFKITPENFAEFLTMIFTGQISSKIAKMLLKEMFETGGDPSQIIEDKAWHEISDRGELEDMVKQVITENLKPVDDYQKGREAALQFLAGKVMAKTKGKANPQKIQEILKKLLS